MHDHQPDLVLDLLDRPGLSESEVAARLDGCSACLADLDEQRSMRAALERIQPVALAEGERAELRSSVMRELDAEVVTPFTASRPFDWMRVGTVAAAFLGLVVVAGLAADIGSNDADGQNLAAEVEGDEATGADTAVTSAAMEESLERADMATADDAGNAGAETGTAIAPFSDLVLDLGDVSESELGEELARLADHVEQLTESSPILRSLVDPDRVGCLDVVDDLGAVRGLATAVLDGTDVEAYVTLDGATAIYTSSDCAPVDLD